MPTHVPEMNQVGGQAHSLPHHHHTHTRAGDAPGGAGTVRGAVRGAVGGQLRSSLRCCGPQPGGHGGSAVTLLVTFLLLPVPATACPQIRVCPEGLEVGGAVTLTRMMRAMQEQIRVRPAMQTRTFQAVVDQLRYAGGGEGGCVQVFRGLRFKCRLTHTGTQSTHAVFVQWRWWLLRCEPGFREDGSGLRRGGMQFSCNGGGGC